MFLEKNIIRKKMMEAAFCWHTASKFVNYSPTAKKVLEGMRNFLGGPKLVSKITRPQLKEKCEKLILIENASVRLMAIRAMGMIRQISKNLGLISSLLASKETGKLIHYPTGESLEDARLSDEVGSYLFGILDIRKADLFSRLKEADNHWFRLLVEYSQKKNKENYLNCLNLFRYDLKEILQETSPVVRKKRNKEIKNALRQIIEYNLCRHQEISVTVIVLERLAWIARGRFPGQWLVEIVEETARNKNLSSNLSALQLKQI